MPGKHPEQPPGPDASLSSRVAPHLRKRKFRTGWLSRSGDPGDRRAGAEDANQLGWGSADLLSAFREPRFLDVVLSLARMAERQRVPWNREDTRGGCGSNVRAIVPASRSGSAGLSWANDVCGDPAGAFGARLLRGRPLRRPAGCSGPAAHGKPIISRA